jgi:adenylate cyclase
VPLVWPLAGLGGLQVFTIASRLISEQRAKAKITGMFGTYVSPELVKRMVDSGESPRLGGHLADITAYFSDIQGFSRFSEQLPPDRLVELMNEYLTACTDIVQEEGGTLDKYIGDAVVVMFGAPVALPDHAYRACVAALRVQKRLGELREKWRSEGDKWPQIVWRMQSRIGLNSGGCTIGNMGSSTRFNYTMMGDNVNLAARMESGAKHWGVYTMCSEATKLACERHGGDRLVFRSLGQIVVLGRSQPVPVFEIVGLREDVSPQTRECMAEFEAGLARYFARDWDGAIAAFDRSEALEPNRPGQSPGVSTNPSLFFGERARYHKLNPPPKDWNGVYAMSEK